MDAGPDIHKAIIIHELLEKVQVLLISDTWISPKV